MSLTNSHEAEVMFEGKGTTYAPHYISTTKIKVLTEKSHLKTKFFLYFLHFRKSSILKKISLQIYLKFLPRCHSLWLAAAAAAH